MQTLRHIRYPSYKVRFGTQNQATVTNLFYFGISVSTINNVCTNTDRKKSVNNVHDEKQSSTKGSYIVFKQRLNYEGHQREVFWYAKIKSINSSTLILETEEGTITFESI